MPTRMLREGILDSEAVNSLSMGAEVFYRRLMSVVDDYGRFHARTSVLRSRLYPTKVDSISEADVGTWLGECEKAGLVTVYVVDGKPYVVFHRLGKARSQESKYPPPPPQSASVYSGLPMNTGAPYSDSYSTSDAGTTTGSAGGAPAAVGRSAEPDEKTIPFDPLRAAEKDRKDFEKAWNAAGLRKLNRLPHSLHGRLTTLLGLPEWRKIWREALDRAGKIPFLAIGLNRNQGPLDPSDFLREDDFAHAILRGKYDPRPQQTQTGRPPPVVVPDRFAAIVAAEEAEERAKAERGAA